MQNLQIASRNQSHQRVEVQKFERVSLYDFRIQNKEEHSGEESQSCFKNNCWLQLSFFLQPEYERDKFSWFFLHHKQL